jgi:peptidoglycan/LPS O-acetylase OafA/YrhL
MKTPGMRERKDVGSSPPQRLYQIDGLRGVAMLFVFMGHFASVWHDLVHPHGAAGFFLRVVDADATLGSSFFMLLSAFFVYGSRMRARKTFRDFLVGRLWRLYPLYLVMTGIYLAGCLLVPHISKIPADRHNAALFVLENLLFLPGLLPVQPLMDVAWTLSFVVYFYFIEALLALMFQLAGVTRGRRIAVLSACAVLWVILCASRGWWEYRTGLFWVGMIVWEIVDEVSSNHVAWAVRMTGPATAIRVNQICRNFKPAPLSPNRLACFLTALHRETREETVDTMRAKAGARSSSANSTTCGTIIGSA